MVVVVFVIYFLLCLVVFRVLHLGIDWLKLRPWAVYASCFVLGGVAWLLMKYVIVGEILANRIKDFWPVAFLVALVALFLYDNFQARWSRGGGHEYNHSGPGTD